jgi:hypothetical protein
VVQECSIHDQACGGAFVTLGPGRKIKLEEWVMHLRMMASARNNTEEVVEVMGPVDQAGAPDGECHHGQEYMDGVDSHEGDRFVMTYMYVDCDYMAPTGAMMDEAVKWIEIHDRARHQQPVIQQQQQTLREKNKLVGKPVNSVVTEREDQKLKAVSNTLGEDPEGGSFAKDISTEGWSSCYRLAPLREGRDQYFVTRPRTRLLEKVITGRVRDRDFFIIKIETRPGRDRESRAFSLESETRT